VYALPVLIFTLVNSVPGINSGPSTATTVLYLSYYLIIARENSNREDGGGLGREPASGPGNRRLTLDPEEA
jgi:hypothetical protein